MATATTLATLNAAHCCVRALPAFARALHGGGARAAASLCRLGVLGAACAFVRRPEGARDGAGVGAGSARIESHRAAVHGRWIGGFFVSGAARGRICVAAEGYSPRRRHEAERIVDQLGSALRSAGQQADDRRATQLRAWLDEEFRLLTNCAWWCAWGGLHLTGCWRTKCGQEI